MKLLFVAFRHLARAKAGVTSLEYALLASLIGLVIIGSVTASGLHVDDKFKLLSESFNLTDDPPSSSGPPPPPGPVVANTGSNDTGDALGDTGESTDTAGGVDGSVIISATDLLAAAHDTGLSVEPAAGPADGTQTAGGTKMAAAEGRGGGSSQSRSQEADGKGAAGTSSPKNVSALSVGNETQISAKGSGGKGSALLSSMASRSGSSRGGPGSIKVSLSKGGPSGNEMKSEIDTNFLSGSEGLAIGLFGMLVAFFVLGLIIWKTVQRAMIYSKRKNQLSEWQKYRGK